MLLRSTRFTTFLWAMLLTTAMLTTALLTTACNDQQPPVTPAAQGNDAPTEVDDTSAYPSVVGAYPGENESVITEMPYPAPDEVSEPSAGEKGPRFFLAQPGATDTVVTGTAPRDIPLAIVDVTLAGTILGTGRSDSNGDFSITVSDLRSGNRIGLTVFDASRTMEDAAVEYFDYRGDNFYNAPNIGIFMDTVQVSDN